jgi:plastocyanin
MQDHITYCNQFGWNFGPNAAYSITGSEVYLNSGKANMHALAFQKAGTYNYFCEIHLWMHGSVIAK